MATATQSMPKTTMEQQNKQQHTLTSLNNNDKDAQKMISESQDLSVFVEDMLDQMKSRFGEVGDSIMGRMDDMGKRMDDLERSITDLMDQAGLEAPDGTSSVVTGSSPKIMSSNKDTSNTPSNGSSGSNKESQQAVI